jgi:beta-glucosidase
MRPQTRTSPDGIEYRDLNGNQTMDPYENATLPVEVRVADLLARLSPEEKVGLLFHTVIEAGPDGSVLQTPGQISKSPTPAVVKDKLLNHFNVHALGTASAAARWHNAVQALAEQTPHGIPVTISSDPRHGFQENPGASFVAGSFSQWPEPIGLGAIGDVELARLHGDVTRQEYLAVGIRAALHPTADLATEPRWGRQSTTFGQDSDLVTELVDAFLQGLQGDELGPTGVAGTTKHFPGGGPQKDGEDPHFPYGREQTYTGGRFADHLKPFVRAIARGTSAMMPYYGMPVGLELDGEPIEQVGFGYNKQIVTGLLREQLGFDGVVVTDWELINDNVVGDLVLPARAWGVEHLDPLGRLEKLLAAGVDQFGGEECPELVLELLSAGRVDVQRIDESVRRLLTVKFQLGLFDNPYVDEDAATDVVGRTDFVAAGHRAQAESVTVLVNSDGRQGPVLPLRPELSLYVEGVDPAVAAEYCTVVDDPAAADLALVRVKAPYEERNSYFLEEWFHAGSLEFHADVIQRLGKIAEQVPLVVDVTLDRPAIMTPITEIAAGLVATYGSSDRALLDALTKRIQPRGRLPFEAPRSMEAVAVSRPDVPSDTVHPLFEVGHRVEI